MSTTRPYASQTKLGSINVNSERYNCGVGVLLSVNEETNHSNSNETNATKDNSDNDGVAGSLLLGGNNEHTLLGAVGEVVVTGGLVVEGTSAIHLDQTSIEIGALGTIELRAILCIVVIVGVGIRVAIGGILINVGHASAECLAVKHVLLNSFIAGTKGDVRVKVGNLHDVRTISSSKTLSGVAIRIGVASSPLEVNVVSFFNVESVRSEIIFRCWIGLHNVTALSTHVEIVDLVSFGDTLGSGGDTEHVGTILEGSSILSSVKRKSQGLILHSHGLVVLDERVVARINEFVSDTR